MNPLRYLTGLMNTLWDQQKKQTQAKQSKVALPRKLRKGNIGMIVSGLEKTLEPPSKDVMWTITNQLKDEVCCQGRSPEERRLHLPPLKC